MRINKYIAASGVCSRRKADALIEEGKVSVNGAVLTEPGYDVRDGDEVMVFGKTIDPEEDKIYYLLYKPVGCLTTVPGSVGNKAAGRAGERGGSGKAKGAGRSERGGSGKTKGAGNRKEDTRPTVMDLIDDADHRLFPVGRLDYNTSGVLFITNDGEFSHHMSHPAGKIDKVYRVRIAGTISKEDLSKLRHGVDIGGFTTSRAKVDVISWTKHSTLLEVTIHEGKNRQVRRMFKAVGKNVEELCRLSEGGIGLGHLKPGQYRRLNPNEVNMLLGL